MNKRSLVSTAFALGLLLLGACSGCPSTPSGPTTIIVQPDRVPIFAGAEQAFEASGGGGRVIWSISGGGTIRVEDTPDASRAFVTAGNTMGTFQVTARTADRAGSASFQVVTQRSNSNNVERFVPAPGNVPVIGCRVTFVTSYITAEDGLQMRAVLFDASNTEAPAFLPTSVPLAAAGQVQLQGGTTSRTTEAVEIVFSKAGSGDVFRQRYAAHYVWPGCS